MVFKSKKGTFFRLMTASVTLTSLVMTAWSIFSSPPIPIISIILFYLPIGVLLWAYFNTSYELTKESFKYESAFLKGTISLNRIHTIVKNKTLLSGIKPATASGGLIIKYDKHEEIYISPESNDSFLDCITRLNQHIQVK